jgi:uncharacterized protein (TIGR02611 family)
MADEPALVRRLRAQRDAHRDRSRIVRALAVLAGTTLTLGGVAMLILPGPAFVVIPVGLAILSLEFTWAERALDRTVVEGERAKRRATQTTRGERLVTGAAIALGAAAVLAWASLGDIPLLPV